jgi:serine/threonine protein phosphatase PrpC
MPYLHSVESLNGRMDKVAQLAGIDSAEVCYFNLPNPQRAEENHDSLWIASPSANRFLLCVADGAGGHRTPGEASANLLTQLKDHLEDQELSLDHIIRSIESSNEFVRLNFSQSRSTLVMAMIDQNLIRTLHIGDSKIVIVGGRGKLKYETIGHNLSELSENSGLSEYIDKDIEVPANVVTNMIGDMHFRMELSSQMELAPNDTVVAGSDGLFDNLSTAEICEMSAQSPSSMDLGLAIQQACSQRMAEAEPSAPTAYKPDDLAFIIYRRSEATKSTS